MKSSFEQKGGSRPPGATRICAKTTISKSHPAGATHFVNSLQVGRGEAKNVGEDKALLRSSIPNITFTGVVKPHMQPGQLLALCKS